MKTFMILLFTLYGTINAQEIEGRWNPGGFNNTMYEFVDGLRYTYYCPDTNGCDEDYWNSLDTSDAIPNPNPYWVDGNTLTIDIFFGNEATYEISYRCDGQVVDLYYDGDDWVEGLHSSMFRTAFDYINSECDICTIYDEQYCSWLPGCQWDNNQCNSMPEECFDLSEINFGMCDMYLGVGWDGYQCNYFSGCNWVVDGIDYSDNFYDSLQECEESCQCEDGDINNDNPCNPKECWDGQWIELIIDCAEDMGIPCEEGVYISPPEDECCSTCILFGDSNYDGTLNILDVILLVDIILYDGQCANWFQCPEDINIDGTLNILDVIELVNNILD